MASVKSRVDSEVVSSEAHSDYYNRILEKNRTKLLKCFRFEPNWLANEMCAEGLLPDSDRDAISDVKKVINEEEKATIIMKSLVLKVDINYQHLNTFIKILEKKRVFRDAIDILQARSTANGSPTKIARALTSVNDGVTFPSPSTTSTVATPTLDMSLVHTPIPNLPSVLTYTPAFPSVTTLTHDILTVPTPTFVLSSLPTPTHVIPSAATPTLVIPSMPAPTRDLSSVLTSTKVISSVANPTQDFVTVSSKAIPVQLLATPPPKRIKLDGSSSGSINKVSKDFELHLEVEQKIRSYQEELAEPGLNGENYILVAPTGTGKTLVAAKIIADHLQKNKDDPHVAFVVPTKALADQQRDALSKYIPDASVVVCTAETQRSIAESCLTKHISVCTGGKLYTEICRNELKFSKLSLIIFDECHSAVRGTTYANIMKHYVEDVLAKNSDNKQVQIIGMTASPGAGKNPHVEFKKCLDHLKMLMAHLNATSGIKTVVRNIEELEYYRNAPKLHRVILPPRDPANDPFIEQIVKAMVNIEASLKEFKYEGLKKWSLEYEKRVRQSIFALELSDNEEFRNPLCGFNELLGYCTTMSVYMNLRATDAIKVLKEYMNVLEDNDMMTPAEKEYSAIRQKLIEKLELLNSTDNPLLLKMEDILHSKFESKENSRGLIFVRTRMEARAMKEWILDCKRLIEAGICPGIIVGHTSRKKDAMTQEEQKIIVEKFRKGEVNLLLATSVAEEGLDIPACNLVMRYQYVVTDIKKEQAEGRARATDSECYTIVSANSNQKYRDMRNEDLIHLVRNILTSDLLPKGNDLIAEIKALQGRIIAEKKKKEETLKQKRIYKGSDILLICKNCKVVACSGSDIRTTGENEPYFHYIVQAPEFKEKYFVKPHHSPGALTDTIFKTHKIYCKKCRKDWGVDCVWSDGCRFPVIKCVYFTFKIGDNFLKVKKWSHAPFEIYPMDENVENEPDTELVM